MELKMDRPVDGLLAAISMPSCKRIHFIDVENLVGKGWLSADDVRPLALHYKEATNSDQSDLLFIASGPQNKDAVFEGWAWGNKFFQFRKGKDGADLALITLFNNIVDIGSYEQIFVGSGDGILSNIAERAEQTGVPVQVVTGMGGKSRALMKYPGLKLNLGLGLAVKP